MLRPWKGGVKFAPSPMRGALQPEHRTLAEQPAEVGLDVVQHLGTGGEDLFDQDGVGYQHGVAEHRDPDGHATPVVRVSHSTVRRREATKAKAPSGLGSRGDGGSLGRSATTASRVGVWLMEASKTFARRWYRGVPGRSSQYGTLRYQGCQGLADDGEVPMSAPVTEQSRPPSRHRRSGGACSTGWPPPSRSAATATPPSPTSSATPAPPNAPSTTTSPASRSAFFRAPSPRTTRNWSTPSNIDRPGRTLARTSPSGRHRLRPDHRRPARHHAELDPRTTRPRRGRAR